MDQQADIYIEEMTTFSEQDADALRKLVSQLDTHFQPLTDDDVSEIIQSSSTHLYVARLKNTQEMAGMVTLVVYRIPYKMKAQLEDIVVDGKFRGQGIGKKLMQYAIEKARELGVKSLNFTSNPQRESANRLYQSLGFEKRDTNVYRLTFQ